MGPPRGVGGGGKSNVVAYWPAALVVGIFSAAHGRVDQVGLYDSSFKFDIGDHLKSGTRANKAVYAERRANEHHNNALLYRMYKGLHHRKGTLMANELNRMLKPNNPIVPWTDGVADQLVKGMLDPAKVRSRAWVLREVSRGPPRSGMSAPSLAFAPDSRDALGRGPATRWEARNPARPSPGRWVSR